MPGLHPESTSGTVVCNKNNHRGNNIDQAKDIMATMADEKHAEQPTVDAIMVENTPNTQHSTKGDDSTNKTGWWGKLSASTQYAVVYITFIFLSLFARLMRADISDGGTPVFDEKHYAVQARQMMFNAGNLENYPGYGLVVHPPLGKWLISLGQYVGGYTPLGWRLSSIIAGVIIVVAIIRIIQLATSGSIAAMIAAGLVANMEGTQLVMSKMAMLDVFLALFVTIMAWCIMEDYHRDNTVTPFHKRWWLLGSGIAAGLAMGVKVSGVFYPALAGILMVVIVALSSKDVRTTAKAFGMGLVFYMIVPVCVTILTWLPWFNQENSVYRHIAEAGRIEHELPGWLSSWLPDSINSFMSYQIGVMKFHTKLKSGVGFDNLHPWESKPDQWILSASRPMLFLDTDPSGQPLFGSGESSEKFYLVGNVAVWYLIIPMVLFGIYKLITTRSMPWLIILSGIALGTIPWVINYDRQQYFFYVTQFSMFMIIGVILMIYQVSEMVAKKAYPLSHQEVARVLLSCYIFVVTVVFILYIPWMYSLHVPNWYHEMLELWDSWKILEKY